MDKPIKILIVEDSEGDTNLALRALRQGGLNPTHRRVQDQAGLRAMLDQESWDAVVSDFQMPSFSGMDALRIVQSTGLDIPFILISGAVGEEVAVEAMKSGASDYVMKSNLIRLAPALERQVEDAKGRAAHRRAQRDLAESEERFRRVFETSLDLILVTDRQGNFLQVSPSSETILGYERSLMVGRSAMDFVHRDDLEAIRERMRVARRGHQIRNFETRYLHRDGRVVNLVWNGVWSEPEQRHFFIGRDMTEQKRVERLKGEFVATVSHELRTPVTSIVGALRLLNSGAQGPLAEPAQRTLEIALRNSQRLAALINDILDIEKLEAGKVRLNLQHVEVKLLVQQAIEAVSGFADSLRVHVGLDGASTEAPVHADHDRLMQVLTNLLSNAIKFSPPDREVVVAVSSSDDLVRVTVRDHGPGIPDDFKDRIFERFAQADGSDARRSGGTGLGLSIAKQIVTRLGGSIGYETPPGGGTIFFVNLPGSGASMLAEATESIAPADQWRVGRKGGRS